jgi:hypothetical protein
MSAPDNPPPPAPNYTGGQVALTIFGVILLLPGACSLFFALAGLADFLQKGYADSILVSLAGLWAICFAISAVGIIMIVMARKRARAPR